MASHPASSTNVFADPHIRLQRHLLAAANCMHELQRSGVAKITVTEYAVQNFPEDILPELFAAGILDPTVSKRQRTSMSSDPAAASASFVEPVAASASFLEPAAASPMPNGSACACCSNSCWLPACVARARKRSRYGLGAQQVAPCPNAPVVGTMFCAACTCAAPGCHNKTRNRTRFCEGKKCPSAGMASRPGDFINAFGLQSIPGDWLPPLHIAAKLGWLFPEMPPLDFVAFRKLVEQLTANRPLEPASVVALFLAHCLKWPPAIQEYASFLSKGPDELTPGGMLAAFCHALLAMDGRPFKVMHDSMSSGRLHSKTGAAVNGQWLGLLDRPGGGAPAVKAELHPVAEASPSTAAATLSTAGAAPPTAEATLAMAEDTEDPPSPAEATSAPSTPGAASSMLGVVPAGQAGGRILKLGKGQTAYRFQDNPDTLALIQAWVAIAEQEWQPVAGGCLPGKDALAFGARARDLAWRFRTEVRGTAGPMMWVNTPAGTQAKPEGNKTRRSKPARRSATAAPYAVKHFAKSLTAAMDDVHWHVDWPSTADGVSMASVLAITPDEHNHCAVLSPWSAKAAARFFGYSPLWISCWACLAGGLSPERQEALLKSPDRPLVSACRAIEKKAHKEDTFSPTLAGIAAQLLKQAAEREAGQAKDEAAAKSEGSE